MKGAVVQCYNGPKEARPEVGLNAHTLRLGVNMLVVELITVAALIVANGFLAMSELALVSAKRPVLERMQRDGSRGAGAAGDPRQ